MPEAMDFLSEPFCSIHTLPQLVETCASCYPERTVFRTADIQVTFGEFRDIVAEKASQMRQHFGTGQRIALWGENSFSWIACYFAVACSGNIAVPLDARQDPAALVRQMRSASVKTVFCSPAVYAAVHQAADTGWPALRKMEEFTAGDVKRHAEKLPLSPRKPEEPAALVFTSGTTGDPEGVLLSHENLASDGLGSADAVHIQGGTILFLPLHHAFCFTVNVLGVMLYGYPIYISQGIPYLAREIPQVKPQHLAVVPMVLDGLYRMAQRAIKNLPETVPAPSAVRQAFGGNLNLLITGGASPNPEVLEAFESLGIRVINGYGITECSPVVACNRVEKRTPGTVGRPLFCCEVKVRHPDAQGRGEICVRGRNVMLGYADHPEKTAEVIENGWFRTGDIGTIDEDGNIALTGRIKNLIILSNGENVSPEGLEMKLEQIEEVAEALVQGCDRHLSARLYLLEDTPEARARVRKKIEEENKRVPAYLQIAEVQFEAEPFQKTATGKIQRRFYESKEA